MSDAWMKPALLGVEHSVSLPAPGELGALLGTLATADDAALAFSRSMGALAACSRAAVQALPAIDTPAPAAADPHALPADHAWAPALASVFGSGMPAQDVELRLRHEACTRLTEVGATLPFTVLPDALDAAARSQALRAALSTVLGARGRWLAVINPAWKFAASAEVVDAQAQAGQRPWHDGSQTDRLVYFRRLRSTDADAARRLLEAGLDEMDARERADIVAALAIGTTPADEALLEGLMKDRSREVRRRAADLLAALPGSTHAQRLQAWLAPLVTAKRGLLGKSWDCNAPQAIDPAWATAAIESKRPQHEALGERAWWLFQLVRQVPLRWWTDHTGMNAAQLLAWAGKTDWTDALHRGWLERVSAAEPDWIEAMLATKAQAMRARTVDLLALLPVAQRERYWPRTLDELGAQGLFHEVARACALGETLSLEYSRPLFASLHDAFASDRLRHDYALRGYVLELAALVHAGALRDARPLSRREDETPAMAECALEFERIVRVRTTLQTPF